MRKQQAFNHAELHIQTLEHDNNHR